MAIIAVDKQGLLEDFKSWGIPASYAERFIDKNKSTAGKVELSGFVFNDSINLTVPSQWVSVQAAFWCRVYRESEKCSLQAQALGAIQSLYYLAGMLGLSSQMIMIYEWWQVAFPLHKMEFPNMQFPHSQDISAVY